MIGKSRQSNESMDAIMATTVSSRVDSSKQPRDKYQFCFANAQRRREGLATAKPSQHPQTQSLCEPASAQNNCQRDQQNCGQQCRERDLRAIDMNPTQLHHRL